MAEMKFHIKFTLFWCQSISCDEFLKYTYIEVVLASKICLHPILGPNLHVNCHKMHIKIRLKLKVKKFILE